MTLYAPKDIDEFRQLCDMFGVSLPEKAGRPPVQKLRDALNDAGHGLDMSTYQSGRTAVRRSAVESYSVSMVAPCKTKNGKVMPMPRTVTLTVDEIRQLTGATEGRGRLSYDTIHRAAAKAKGVDVADTSLKSIATNFAS